MRRILQKIREKTKEKKKKKKKKEHQAQESPQETPQARNTLRVTSSAPLEEVAKLLTQLASSSPCDPRTLVEIEPPGICPVCYNFDPYQVPQDSVSHSNKRPSWARKEYSIPDDIPVADITVQDSGQRLLETAKAGCLYCTTVVAALGAVHPGWETEKTFARILLAAGLPVVVRLAFGTMSTVVMGREEVRGGFGIELPEGQHMNFTITVGEPGKPAVEVEIYRPVIPGDRLRVGGRFSHFVQHYLGQMKKLTSPDIALAPLVQHVGFGEEIGHDARDPRCLDFIKENVRTCVKHHNCGKDGALPVLPDRVLWIEASNPTRIQLLEPQNIRAPFIALSYCWGPVSPSTYLTNAQTLAARKAGIEFTDLPPLFQDVVEVARALGIEYIWIDRLCIIQEDEVDFHAQAPKMGAIYGHATLTIAAAMVATENDRLLVPRDRKWDAFTLDMQIHGLGSLELRGRRLARTLGKEAESGGDFGKMSTRAWIWQERLLAARTVFFTPGALKFECRHHSRWEGFEKGKTGHSWSAKLDNVDHSAWTTLVEEYMGRDITQPSDRLPAMDAVMKHIESSTGWSPFWGLWANALIESLGWSSRDTGQSGDHPECKMNPAYYAPTWSWASVDGPISYVHARPNTVNANDPKRWDLECRSLNGASGLIRVAGHVARLEMHVTVENSSEEPGRLRYYYNVKAPGYTPQEGFPITPDVVLKPGTVTVDGQDVVTVVRVPYGEAVPRTSWTSLCLGILIARTKMRALVLFLGLSSRKPGAWERIGVTDGISPAVFSGSQQRIIDIA